MDDRRKYKRVSIDAVLMCQIPELDNNPDVGFHEISTPMSMDISMGGLQMSTDQDLPIGLMLSIFLSIDTKEKPLEIKGKVAWNRKDPKKEAFKIGVEFVEFTDKRKRKIIQDFVDKND
ncbi:MAG: PilZ domain-containing protein [bacterium]|nr:PilZ domain-containing protein [bacterium]